MGLTDYYNEKSKHYKATDKEGILRYSKASELAELKPGQKILDIGCKKSILKELTDDKDVEYYGIDISETALSEKINKNNFRVADVDSGIPFEDSTFDYVFCLELLEHVEKPSFVLKEIHRVLKKDGVLILSIPNPYCWFEMIINLFHRIPKGSEGHISSWTKQTLNALAKLCGFTINKYVGTFCRVPFTSRFFKDNSYIIFSSNSLFLSRSLIFKLRKV